MAFIWVPIGIVAVSTLGLYAFFWKLKSAMTGNVGRRATNPTKGQAGQPITVHSMYISVPNLTAALSPFTAKVQAFMRMREIKYEEAPIQDFTKSPNGRVSQAFTS